MTDEEYTAKFLDLLRYVSYLKDKKAKVQRFFSGFPLAFRDWIEYDEPQSLEEVIRKLEHYYEQSKSKPKSQKSWKWKDKAKGKWQQKIIRPQDANEKENVAPYKKFNGSQHGG